MFTIITSLEGATSTEIDLTLGAFDYFMNQLTPKHRKRIRYYLITNDSIETSPWSTQINIIRSNNLSTLLSDEADLYLCPFEQKTTKEIKEILKIGLPLLGLEGLIKNSATPKASIILIPKKPSEHRVRTYAHFMNMLYFDPEAKKVLAKAAMRLANTIKDKPAQKFSTTPG